MWQALVFYINPAYKTCYIHDMPTNHLKRRTIYVIEEDGYLEQAVMLCPCGCGNILHMNLITDERPCWSLKKNKNNSISLHPSVWRKKGCCSHFWFRGGKVYWV